MPLTLTGAGPPAGGFFPSQLPTFQMAGLVADARSTGNLWQDAGKTVAAVVDGDPVRVLHDRSSGVDFTAPAAGQRPILHTDGIGHWYLQGDGVDDMLTSSNIAAAQVWCYVAATTGWTSADEIGGYTADAPPAGHVVGRLFPDINTWYTGNSDDVVAFSGGAGLVNGVVGNSNSPAGNFKVIELTKATPFTPTTAFNVFTSNNPSAPRYFQGKIAGWVVLSADTTAALRAKLRTYLGNLAGLTL